MRSESSLEQKKRVWEIDAYRGFLMLLLVCNHLNFTVKAFCINGIYTNFDSYAWVNITDPLHFWFDWGSDGVIYASPFISFLQEYLNEPVVATFFIISGISYGFSRNNLRGGLRLLVGAAFISGFTKLLVIYTGDESQFIRFGALHCYALCHLIYYYLLEERSDKTLLVAAAISLIIGYYLRSHITYSDFAILVPFGIREYGVRVRDYWPVFPMLGWFLIGIVLGKRYYSEKCTRFPKQEQQLWHKPLRFLGRHSGLIYCGHMVVYSLVFIGIGHLFDLY